MNIEIFDIEHELNILRSKQNKSKEDNERRNYLIERLSQALEKDEEQLVNDLNLSGFDVDSVWGLVNTKGSYPNAIPILIDHLQRAYHEKNKEGIVRALAVKESIGKANSILIGEYEKSSKDKESLRWAIGNTIYQIITENDIESILRIVEDKTNGASRQMFVAALGKIKSEKVENVLINLLDDEEVVPQVLEALARMKSKKAKDKISILINHPNALIRKEAIKALKKVS